MAEARLRLKSRDYSHFFEGRVAHLNPNILEHLILTSYCVCSNTMTLEYG